MKQVKQIIILAALLCITSIRAQSIGRTYNSYINKAELNITDGKYADALQQYETAFATTKTEFAVDIYNACACAAKLKNTSKVLILADMLASKGVGEKFFTKNIFKSYIANPAFKKIMEKAERVKEQKATVNKEYTEKLTAFFTLDTMYNRIRIRKHSHSHELPDTLQKLNQANIKNMISLIESEGFYTEDKLGADIVADTIIKTMRRFDVTVLHYLEMGNDKALIEKLKNILLDNLNNGGLKHYHLADLIAMSYRIFDDIGIWTFKKNDCKIYKLTTIPEPDKIKNARELYCMCNLADLEKLLIYKYSVVSDFDFRYSVMTEQINDPDFFYSAFHQIATIKNCQS